jgi:hypothetical protein
MEFRSSPFDHRTEAVQRRTLDRLARVRLRRAEHIEIKVDGREADLPPHLQYAVPVRNDACPTILLAGGDTALQWADLSALVPALAEVLDQPSLENGLSLCILELGQRLGGEVRQPSEQDYAEVFRTRPDAVRQLLALTKGPVRTILDKLYPLVAHLAGLEDAERFNPTGGGADLDSPEAVDVALTGIADRLSRPASELLSVCAKTESLADARNALRLNYADFNRTLSRLGAPYEPIHNVEGHRQVFNFFVQSHRDAILMSIRTLALPVFEQGDPLDRYVELRELSGLEPDASWLDEYDVPPAALIRRHINEWLERVGAPALGKGDSALMPLDEVLEQNAHRVQVFAREAHRVVRAWCWKRQTPHPPVWGREGYALRLAEMAGAEGIMDFRPLTEPDLIAWLSRTARWPGGMKLTISPEALDLSEQDLRAEEEAANHERQRREQERRSIKLDGVLMSAERADFRAIIDHVSKTLSPKLLATPARFAGLEPISSSGSGTKGGTGGRGGGSGGSRTRSNDVQTAAIGLIGELVAYRWLQAKYAVGDECWKSTYRNAVFGGQEGNDSLGYDFVIMGKRGELYFEVKATSGDALELELGESEVAWASKWARTDRYRILFIRNALDSSRRSIHMLPNPLSGKGKGRYRTVGRGLRYEFSLGR